MSVLRRLRRSKAKHEGTFENSHEKRKRLQKEKEERKRAKEEKAAREAFEKMADISAEADRQTIDTLRRDIEEYKKLHVPTLDDVKKNLEEP